MTEGYEPIVNEPEEEDLGRENDVTEDGDVADNGRIANDDVTANGGTGHDDETELVDTSVVENGRSQDFEIKMEEV